MPALRLALLVNLLGLAVLLGGHGVALAGTWLLRHWARSQQRKLAEKASAQAAAVAAEGGQRQAAGHATLDAAATAAGGWPAMLPVAGSRMGAQTARPDSTQQLLAPAVVAHAGSEPPAAPHSATPQLQPPRPDVPLARGLSTRVRQLERRRPQLVRGAALAVLSGSYAVGAACQVAAAGLVDASVVQLVLSFTVVGVALVQRLLLRLALPLALYLCAAAMLAGAAMILVPSLGKGAAGGLEGAGWLGFGLAVVTLLMTIANFITLQASSGLGFTSLGLQLYFLGLSAVVLLPLSLGIDGTHWGAQFGGWAARDWVVLVATSTAVYLGANAALQNATWQLGASTVSLFFGVRWRSSSSSWGAQSSPARCRLRGSA
ncbi:hypothetical protein C2E20_2922 [Micractinium conductrix]|uniref:EamA domain-containing protein n=1 Tax=Micractinium conductrix TaxID=554055 RepID=A0A2P6VI88_9CHLO|nr:hypothetical protein C2E20_2922 [Micractinium conductrix]|eukprot:PSC73805.1 hypothetical protein C2E20_2922 [Micractinium conductrix]